MGFLVGDRVHVPGLGTGVVLELRNHGRCLVEIKGRAVEVRATQLTPAPAENKARRKASVVTAPAAPAADAPA